MTFTSEDVLHSLFFPAFRVKADAIPGRYSSVWFTATKLGEYHLFCAEYCGTRHSGMIGKVIVMEPAEYQAWLTGGAVAGSLSSAASSCSTISPATPATAPTARGAVPRWSTSSASPSDCQRRSRHGRRSYIRESILTPQVKLVAGLQPLMPTFQGLMSEENVMASSST